jgi:2-keto-4-pentenoate hydratase/2-oxohepta-3-ene-1,7-dioic acid hydratase in catechol pathway
MHQIQWHQRSFSPSKIVCVGRNYAAHIEELNNPMPGEVVLFIKPNSAISTNLICPPERCRYETEITFLLQDNQPVAVGLGLDLTLVDVQQRLKSKSLPWEKAKAFDGSAVFTPFVDLPDEWDKLWLRLTINGDTRQEGGVPLMITPPTQLLEEATNHFTLQDGDLLMTGTPKGVGDLHVGDEYHASLWHDQTMLVERQWRVQPPTKN